MTSPDLPSGDGSSTTTARRPLSAGEVSVANPRRLSLEEDQFYQQFMTADPRPPVEQPPPYVPFQRRSQSTATSGTGKGKANPAALQEALPPYSNDIYLEGLWDRKMELVDAIRPSHDRQWRATIVQLQGTSLKFYEVKKEWGWGMAREWAANPNPDNPPWARRSGLTRAYNLQHADVGIAADYRKRRNVIRLRVETEQFLMACVETKTFIKWLDGLFAALAIAHPLDERDFPVDQSVPRSQRSRWLRAQRQATPTRPRYLVPTPRPLDQLGLDEADISHLDDAEPSAGVFGAFGEVNAASDQGRRLYTPSMSSSLLSLSQDFDLDADPWPRSEPQSPALAQPGSPSNLTRSGSGSIPALTLTGTPPSPLSRTPSLRPLNRRSATTSSPHRPPTSAANPPAELRRPSTSGVDRASLSSLADPDKWRPARDPRSPDDDLRYGRLCFAILLYGSPRKSDCVVKRQTKWLVDWETGRMVRVLPPSYREIDQLEMERQVRRGPPTLHVGVGM